ncbi:MAG: T9SS type A sorting domain-containing protein [Bacteroidia bacterium]|nr:T9SS type A sorting domain-containing protein [Bacteroidia bacterium]
MTKTFSYLLLLFCFTLNIKAQTIPTFGQEIPVNFIGVTTDAMEPHLSPDGNALFFNSLNDGITTSLFYGGKINDSTFQLVGAVPIVNQTTTPRLDAVASLDTANNFYWVSTRNYPFDFDNLHRIRFLQSGYTNFGRVHGNFYIYSPGWLIMDAAISHYGEQLIYCNAYFNNCTGVPCKAALGIADKINDSTFNKTANSGAIMAALNDTANYIVYAPQLTGDGLELYFTRLAHANTNTEICVATRNNVSDPFGTPTVLISSPGNLPEAATISTDKSKIYYHKKEGGIFKLFLRYRTLATSLSEKKELDAKFYPNPAYEKIVIEYNSNERFQIRICNVLGEIVILEKDCLQRKELAVDKLKAGTYFVEIESGQKRTMQKLIKQ